MVFHRILACASDCLHELMVQNDEASTVDRTESSMRYALTSTYVVAKRLLGALRA